MKNLIVLLILILILALSGCETVPKCPVCPPAAMIFMTPNGPVGMPKGFFDAGEGDTWMRSDDFEKMVKE